MLIKAPADGHGGSAGIPLVPLLLQNSSHGHEVLPRVRAQRWPCFDGGDDQKRSHQQQDGSPS